MTEFRRVLFLNQYYAPDLASSGQMLSDLVEGLVEIGHSATVVCSQPSYESSVPDASSKEIRAGLEIHRIRMSGTKGRDSLIIRAIGYLRFLLFAWMISRKLIREEKYDAVIALSNPPFIGIIGALIAKKASVPFVSVMYDIHPDIVQATNWVKLPGVFFYLWNSISTWIVKRAIVVVVLGDGMKRTIVETKGSTYEKVKIIPVWARPEFMSEDCPSPDTRSKFGISSDEIVILFSGNIGIMQPVDEILHAALKTRDKKFRFMFLGGGVGSVKIREFARVNDLLNISVLPYQPFDDFKNILLESDICVVSLAEGMERLSVPSRAYTFMSAGKAIIAIMNSKSDIADLVTEWDCGWVVSEMHTLADLLSDLDNDRSSISRKALNARNAYTATLGKKASVDSFSELIFNVT